MCKGLMGEMVCLQVMPDAFNVIQLRRVFGQPLDGEPVSAGGQRSQRERAGVDRTIVLDQHHRFERLARLRTVELTSCSRWATKSPLRLLRLVCTMSWRVT